MEMTCSGSQDHLKENLSVVGHRDGVSGPVVPGGMAVETFYFRTPGYGGSTVTLIERRAWLKDVPPLVTVAFAVVVRGTPVVT